MTALYAAVGEGHVSAQSVVQKLVSSLGGVEGAVEDLAETAIPTRPTGAGRPATPAWWSRPAWTTSGSSWPAAAPRCPGDEILGFVTRGGGVSVHRRRLHQRRRAGAAEPTGMVEVEWAPSTDSVFLVSIQVEALDRHRLLSDVTRVLSDERVNILSASVTTTRDRVAVSRFTFEMGEPKHLGHLLRTVTRRRGRLRRLPPHVGYVTATR